MIELNWEEIKHKIEDFCRTTPLSLRFEFVYGVPRGGIPVAILFSEIAGLRLLENLSDFFEKHKKSRVLIVDDVIDSGKTRMKYKDYEFYAVWNKKIDGDDWVEFPWERMSQEYPVEDSVIRMLEFIGEDLSREGLKETPKRVVKSWEFLFSGYQQDAKDHLKLFDSEGYDEIVLLKDIEIYSVCEHHLLPFFGKCHVAYIPDKKVLGISKLARIVDIFARRAQIQERIANQVTSFLMKELKPKAAACIIEAQHLCMLMRGVQKQNSVMVTSSLKGAFMEKLEAREELMRLIS